jgi:hypothetical protein
MVWRLRCRIKGGIGKKPVSTPKNYLFRQWLGLASAGTAAAILVMTSMLRGKRVSLLRLISRLVSWTTGNPTHMNPQQVWRGQACYGLVPSCAGGDLDVA